MWTSLLQVKVIGQQGSIVINSKAMFINKAKEIRKEEREGVISDMLYH